MNQSSIVKCKKIWLAHPKFHNFTLQQFDKFIHRFVPFKNVLDVFWEDRVAIVYASVDSDNFPFVV